jgi:peptidoglycan/LPS O-acetylase OafA/YrhL
MGGSTSGSIGGERHHLFDGLRGVAALGVALFHLGPGARLNIMPAGYLAVDFFFLLSGFVLTRAYGARLNAGLGFWPFFALRLARLYPVFAIGILLGVPMLWVMAQRASPPAGAGGALLALAANLALLPAPGGFATLFPGNLVCWSLMLEIAINLVFAAVGFRLPTAALLVLAGLAALGLAYAALAFGTVNGGAYRSDAVLGVWRVCLAFPLGVVIGRLRTPVARPGRSAFAVLAVLAVALALPVTVGQALAIELALVLLVFPLLLWWAAGVELPDGGRRLFGWLGRISYPLYAVHFPLLLLVFGLSGRGWPSWLVLAIGLGGALLLANFVAVRLEPAGRRRLQALLLP